MGFVDKLRSARTLGYTNPNIELDSMLRGAINDEHNMNRQEFNDRRSGGFLSGGGGGGNSRGGYLNRGGGFNNRSEFTNPKPMDVVYDQRPELATKQMNLQKQQMAQDAKLEEAKMALMAMKNNDAYIDNRRDAALKQTASDRADFTAHNQLGDREKLAIEQGNRLELQKLKDTADERQLGMTLEQKKQAEIEQSINDWVKTNSRNRIDTENNTRTTDATKASAAARALSTENAARIRMKQEPTIITPSGNTDLGTSSNPELAQLQSLLEPGAPQVDNDVQRRAAAQVVGANNVPMVGGIGSAALGTNVGQLGVPAGGIGKGKLDPNTGQLLNPQDSKNSGFVDMVDPKGRPLKVPANEVDALLKKGAKRR